MNKLETVISVIDKTSAPFILFEKRLQHALGPVDKLKKSLDRLGRVSGVRAMKDAFVGVKNNVNGMVNGVKNIGLAFGVVGYAGKKAADIFNRVAFEGDEIAKTSRRIGISVESLQKFKYAADLAGVPAEQMYESVRKMSIASVQASSGVQKYSSAFKALNVSVKDSNGNLKSNEDLLIELSDRFANSGMTAAEKLFAAQEIFGRSGSKMVELMNQGPDAIRAQFDELEKYGIMTEKDAKASEDYNDSLTKLHSAVNGLAIAFSAKLLPTLTDTIGKITEDISLNKGKWMESLQPLIDVIPDLVKSFADNIPSVMKAIGVLAKGIGKFVDVFGVKWPLIVTVASGVVAPLAMTMASIAKIFWIPMKAILSYTPVIKGVFVKMIPHITKFGSVIRGLGPAFRAAFGPLGMAFAAFEVWKPTIELIWKNLDMIRSITFDDLISCVKQLDKSFDGLRKTISDIPVIGTLMNKVAGIGSKVDFSGVAGDSVAEAMLEGSDPSASVGKSKLYQTSTTKTITKNNNSTIDVNFHNVPDTVDIKRRGFSFGNSSMYGNSFVPYF